MDQQQLKERLEDRAADVPVGAPPIDAMRAAVRRRRGRTAVLAAAAAVAVIAAGSVGWQLADRDSQTPVVTDPPVVTDVPPEGFRYVGIGRAVIAVPNAWGTNETECGTPQSDTVIVDVGAICLALVPRPDGVESIEVRPPYETMDIGGWTPFEIAGQPALRAPDSDRGDFGSNQFAQGTVYLPEQDAMFVVESSSPDGAAIVDRLLDGIDVLAEHVTVPGFQDLAAERGPDSMAERYEHRLERAGLTIEVVQEPSQLPEGTVLETTPAVGTVVAPGARIRVTVSG